MKRIAVWSILWAGAVFGLCLALGDRIAQWSLLLAGWHGFTLSGSWLQAFDVHATGLRLTEGWLLLGTGLLVVLTMAGLLLASWSVSRALRWSAAFVVPFSAVMVGGALIAQFASTAALAQWRSTFDTLDQQDAQRAYGLTSQLVLMLRAPEVQSARWQGKQGVVTPFGEPVHVDPRTGLLALGVAHGRECLVVVESLVEARQWGLPLSDVRLNGEQITLHDRPAAPGEWPRAHAACTASWPQDVVAITARVPRST